MNNSVEARAGTVEPRPKGKLLSEIDKTKNETTGRASDVGRQLAYAGIATVWLLRNDTASRPLGDILLIALLFMSAALLTDFFQYVHCSRIWKRFYNEQFDLHGSDNARVDIPPALTAPMYTYFWTKFGFLILGYLFLIIGSVSRLQIF